MARVGFYLVITNICEYINLDSDYTGLLQLATHFWKQNLKFNNFRAGLAPRNLRGFCGLFGGSAKTNDSTRSQDD
jgi:hypothetical protein